MAFLDTITNALKDSYDRVIGDVSRLTGGDLSAALDIYDQFTRGPSPLGRVPVNALAQAFTRGAAPAMGAINPRSMRTLTDLPANVSGGIKALRNPLAMQDEMRAALNVMADRYPALMEKVLASPTMLRGSMSTKESAPRAFGSLGTTRPTVAMAEKLGKPEQALDPLMASLAVRNDVIGDPKGDTLVHELTHMLNFPRVQGTAPEDAATIGMLLNDLMKGNKASLTKRLHEYGPIGPYNPAYSAAEKANPEFLADLKDAALMNKRAAAESPKMLGREGYYKPGETVQDFTARAIMDEGLAHLSERTTTPYGDPKMMALADALGVGTGMKPKGPVPLAELMGSLRVNQVRATPQTPEGNTDFNALLQALGLNR